MLPYIVRKKAYPAEILTKFKSNIFQNHSNTVNVLPTCKFQRMSRQNASAKRTAKEYFPSFQLFTEAPAFIQVKTFRNSRVLIEGGGGEKEHLVLLRSECLIPPMSHLQSGSILQRWTILNCIDTETKCHHLKKIDQ